MSNTLWYLCLAVFCVASLLFNSVNLELESCQNSTLNYGYFQLENTVGLSLDVGCYIRVDVLYLAPMEKKKRLQRNYTVQLL